MWFDILARLTRFFKWDRGFGCGDGLLEICYVGSGNVGSWLWDRCAYILFQARAQKRRPRGRITNGGAESQLIILPVM